MELQVEYVGLKDIKPYENNARAHGKEDVEAIVKSIQEFGFNDPIGIWHGTIVEGHGRFLAAKKLKLTKVPVIRLDDLTDEQRRAYMLAHNKTAELSSWDYDTLAKELKDLADFDMAAFGFDLDELPEDVDIIEDEAPEPPEKPKTKVGEIWQLGVHRLMCGDSTDPEAVEKLLGGYEPTYT